MVKYYITKNAQLQQIDAPVKNCWINMVHPTDKELMEVITKYNIEEDDLKAALDEEEISRVTREDEYTLILVDIPSVEDKDGKSRFTTIPLGIIFAKDVLITVCLEPSQVLSIALKKKNTDTKYRSRVVLQILLENAKLYLKNLRAINREHEKLEVVLHRSIENAALLEMMELGRSLLYFTTSLKGNNAVIEKLSKLTLFTQYEEDEDLLEDVQIESKQAMEMAETYSGVINGTMDGYASVISNNMNLVQKFLAMASVVIAVPSIIFDAYGMNLATGLPFSHSHYASLIIIALALVSAFAAYNFLKNKKTY